MLGPIISPMSNLYEQFICEFLAKVRYRPRMRVFPQTLTIRLTRGNYWGACDRDLPPGLLDRLVQESCNPCSLGSCFAMNPRVDQSRAAALELLGEHYSSLPLNRQFTVEFGFSPIVDSDDLSLFYAHYNGGPLWAAAFLCLGMSIDGKLTLRDTRCLHSS